MASVCKRQQCTIDRRGFRQELDSWRHKLIHCVGFESILEGLFDPELVEDLKLFKDLEPTAVSDWSFDENCLFCCLRRDKVKEHLIGISDEELEDRPKPVLIKDQTTISRLERQAEEFLNAVLCRKDVPNFSDPHIPVVAREILQRMIRQFAAEYTSKTSSPQDSHKDFQPHSDQSMATPPLHSRVTPSTSPTATVTGPAHNQNPVLSKLLMADQDAPLDLTIKKPLAVPSDQDGVLDLSIKKNRNSSSLPVHSPFLSSTFKGEYPDLCVSKAKDLQSTSTLELFMAKLCPHHQRQMVDAIGFLQAEVKALASSNTQQNSNSTSGIQGSACSTAKSSVGTPEKPCLEFTPKSEAQDVPHSTPSSCAAFTENAVSLKTSMNAGPALDLHQPGSGSNRPVVTLATNRVDADNNRHGDHAPLKMKIMTSNVADGKKLSCVLNNSLSSHSDILDDREENSIPSSRTETHSARLSSSVKRHSQTSHTHQAKQRETVRQTKDTPAKLFSVHMALPSDSPRTARKTVRASSDNVIRGSVCMGLTDPDLGHCDIVFIDKPITECFKKKHRGMLPRRNARKSTRGHMYSDEIWELKTVRTLAGRGNCPNPMPEIATLITPKQILSKPEGVPPLDMPFAAVCMEAMNQMSTDESDEHVIPDTGDVVEVAVSEGVDVIVETSQTDQCQSREQSLPSSIRCPTENKDTNINTDVEQNTSDSGMTTGNEENVAQVPVEAERENEHEPQENICESNKQIVAETVVEELKDITRENIELLPLPGEQLNGDSIQLENSAPSLVNQVVEKREENKREEMQVEQPQELQPETQVNHDNCEVTGEFNTTGSAEDITMKEPEIKMTKVVENVMPSGTDDGTDTDDLSSKTLDALLKELPPWRRKRGTVISLPKRLRQTEAVIVGYVNGRPVSSSDRSLRRRSSNSAVSPVKTEVKSIKKAPNTTSLDSGIKSSFVNEIEDKHLSVENTPAEPCETTRVIQQVQESTSATPPSSTSKCSSRIQQIQKRKRGQRDQDSSPILNDQPIDCPNVESKRQLRSAGQRSAGTLASPPTSNTVTSISSPKIFDSNAHPSTLHLQSSPLPSPLPDTSPPIRSSPPAPDEQSQQDTVPETTVELNIEKTLPPAVTPKEIQKNECKRLQAKQKLKFGNAVTDVSKMEEQQLSMETPSLIENQNPVKTEMQTQIMPLRSKRVLRKEAETSDDSSLQKPNIASSDQDMSASGDDSSSSVSDKPIRIPLRSEGGRTEMSQQSITQSPQVENKKLALRSQSVAPPSTSALPVTRRLSESASPLRIKPERLTKAQLKPHQVSVPSVLPHSSSNPGFTPRPEPPKHAANKFFQTLTSEENQHLITNLNVKYDKMLKGWVQMDKEGQPVTKYKNKADRQAAIWKSKRRARKPKSLEHQKYSPVQMLFMKSFNLTNICRWFLDSTETKSLVIVKKVNTRLPSETQLCFHSSSSAAGTSQGLFPSQQAERLKKHLKKFAIASPVKSNAKSQKLIAKALEQEPNIVKGKERRELQNVPHTLAKSHSSEAVLQIVEPQKSCGKSKNPASARILRKYSHIREKMQVQQTNVRRKEGSKTLRTNSMKKLGTTKSAQKANLKPSLKAQKAPLQASKQMKESEANVEKKEILSRKKTTKHLAQEKAVKTQSSSRASKDATKKELPKRCSQRLGSPKIPEHRQVNMPKSKVNNKKPTEAEKVEVEKPQVHKVNAAKIQTKESSQPSAGSETTAEAPQQSTDVKVPTSPDQILTRSQRKIEAAVHLSVSPSHASKKAAKPSKTQTESPKPVRKAEEHALRRSWALKLPVKRSQAESLPRSANKRNQELLETPAKRTRTSVSK